MQLEELEVRLERLRALYEQYFLGLEKVEPSVARKDVDRRIWLLKREQIRNTARRFKLQTVIQRYNTFQQYWQRICREIENGTYRRHLVRAERILKGTELLTIAARRRAGRPRPSEQPAPESAPPEEAERLPNERPESVPEGRPSFEAPPEELDIDMAFFEHALLKPGQPPRPAPPRASAQGDAGAPPAAPRSTEQARPPPRRPPPRAPRTSAPQQARPPAAAAQQPSEPKAPAAVPAGAPAASAAKSLGTKPVPVLSEQRVRELHERLIDVKKKNNERGNVSLDNLARSLRETETKLRQKHGNRRIDFDVIVKNGRVVLKPIVR
jgi:hypothetical protein